MRRGWVGTRVWTGMFVAAAVVGGLGVSAGAQDPGEPLKLNGPMQPSGDVQVVEVSADGRWVVYRADEEVPAAFGPIYVSQASGGPRVRLSERRVDSFAIDPTSSVVVYSERNARLIYAIDIDGTNRRVLAEDRGTVVDFTPDGASVLLRLGDESRLQPLDGSDPTVLLDGAEQPQLSDDGSMVVARLRRSGELVAQAAGGGEPVVLTAPRSGSTIDSFVVSDDGSLVAYRTDVGTGNELHAVPTSGGDPVRIDRDRPWRADIGSKLVVAEENSVVLFRSDQDAAFQLELYAGAADGSGLTRLNGPLIGGGDVKDWDLSPDGQTVVYVADQEVARRRELFAVPVEGGTATKLNTDLPDRGDVGPPSGNAFEISADSTTVVFLADQVTNNVHELWSVPISGGEPIKLNGPLPAGGDVKISNSLFGNGIELTPDGTVVYVADQDTNNVRELWAVDIGGGTPVKLNGPMTPKGDVLPRLAPWVIITPRAQVVYVADQDTNHRREVYLVDLPAS